MQSSISGYRWASAELTCAHDCLLPAVVRELAKVQQAQADSAGPRTLFDLGCGNGSVDNELVKLGWDVTGVDPSTEGIARARESYPNLNLQTGSAYDDLAAIHGQFHVVLSLEVVEHVYAPRHFAATLYALVESGGTAIVSTPYHGYWKNLALAVTGRMDTHFTALWDHGHIKFWSTRTLAQLLHEAGFASIRFERVGRIPALARSMLAIAHKA